MGRKPLPPGWAKGSMRNCWNGGSRASPSTGHSSMERRDPIGSVSLPIRLPANAIGSLWHKAQGRSLACTLRMKQTRMDKHTRWSKPTGYRVSHYGLCKTSLNLHHQSPCRLQVSPSHHPEATMLESLSEYLRSPTRDRRKTRSLWPHS